MSSLYGEIIWKKIKKIKLWFSQNGIFQIAHSCWWCHNYSLTLVQNHYKYLIIFLRFLLVTVTCWPIGVTTPKLPVFVSLTVLPLIFIWGHLKLEWGSVAWPYSVPLTYNYFLDSPCKVVPTLLLLFLFLSTFSWIFCLKPLCLATLSSLSCLLFC